MINIPTHNRYLNYKIEVENFPDNPLFPEEYVLELPHAYGANKTYDTISAGTFKGESFSGSVACELYVQVKDSEGSIYEKPAQFIPADGSGTPVSVLDETTNNDYLLADNTIEKLIIRVGQIAPGAGKILFVFRGL
jgi:hypothetical protein